MQQDKLLNLIDSARLNKIPYSEKPLPQGGKILFLTPAELEEKLNFSYTESLMGDRDELTPEFLGNEKLLQKIEQKPDLPNKEAILARLSKPLESLVICDMGPEVGHGLFARDNIPAGTILFLYSGVIEPIKGDAKESDYAYSWASFNVSDATKIINAKKHGGLTRFLQHLPMDNDRHKQYLKQEMLKHFGEGMLESNGINLDAHVDKLMEKAPKSELTDIVFKSPDLISQLATSNVSVSQTVISGIPVVVCWTEYGIEKHEQAGFCYGDSYWPIPKKPRYFRKNGQLIELTEYGYKNETPQVSMFQQQSQNPLVLYQQGVKYYKENNFSLAIANIEAALGLYKIKTGERSDECGNCYSTLASCCRELNDIEKAIEYANQAVMLREGNHPAGHELIVKAKKKLGDLQELVKHGKSLNI